jgi:hypothetical protein
METVVLGLTCAIVIALSYGISKILQNRRDLDDVTLHVGDDLRDKFLSIEIRFDKIESELRTRVEEHDKKSVDRDNHLMDNISEIANAVDGLNKKVDNSKKGY